VKGRTICQHFRYARWVPPLIAATIVSISRPEPVAHMPDLVQLPVPEAVWGEIDQIDQIAAL
jgi:hypothetical protein